MSESVVFKRMSQWLIVELSKEFKRYEWITLTRRVFLLLVCGVILSASLSWAAPVRVLFFGDSLTAGYGLDPSQAYPARIQELIDAEPSVEAKVLVGAVSGDTSAGGLRRIDWMLRQPVDVFVLALGANDGLRGMDVEVTQSNLQSIVERVRKAYPKVKIVIAGIRLPPSLGVEYTDNFEAIYPSLARTNKVALVPYLLEGVGGVVALNLPDRIHPNAEGHKILAANVWEVLFPLLKNY